MRNDDVIDTFPSANMENISHSVFSVYDCMHIYYMIYLYFLFSGCET